MTVRGLWMAARPLKTWSPSWTSTLELRRTAAARGPSRALSCRRLGTCRWPESISITVARASPSSACRVVASIRCASAFYRRSRMPLTTDIHCASTHHPVHVRRREAHGDRMRPAALSTRRDLLPVSAEKHRSHLARSPAVSQFDPYRSWIDQRRIPHTDTQATVPPYDATVGGPAGAFSGCRREDDVCPTYLLASRSHKTELATTVQCSQSPSVSAWVEKATCRNGA